jgi:hypothetical protein
MGLQTGASGRGIGGQPPRAQQWTLQREVETLVVLARCDDPQVALRAIAALRDLMRRVRKQRPDVVKAFRGHSSSRETGS